MCASLMPARWLNISPMMCCGVPVPAEPKLSRESALPLAIRSFTEVMPEAGLTTITNEVLTTGAT